MPIEDSITISSEAVEAVQAILSEKKLDNHALRLYVAGSGCSGTQFGMALDDKVHSNDTAFKLEGIKIIVDSQSLIQMEGASINYVNDPQKGVGFVINAPQPVQNSCSSCSSGSSCGY